MGSLPFLDTFLDERLDRRDFAPLQIRPLLCSDIETLEIVVGHFGTLSLPQILEKWFNVNSSLTMAFLAIDLGDNNWQENGWLLGEWRRIFKKMVVVLFPDKDPELALVEAEKNFVSRGQLGDPFHRSLSRFCLTFHFQKIEAGTASMA